MATPFGICSYNLHGLNQGKPLLDDLCKQFSIIFVQEHWLSTEQLYKFDSISSDFLCFSKSSMDNVCSTGVLKGRPFGGLAIFVHSKLSPHTKFVAADSNYLIVLCCGVLLINVYFPCVSTVRDYGTLLCDICTAIGHVIDLNPDMPVVLGGDMNFNFTDSDNGFMIFKQWMKEYNLINVSLAVDSPTSYTYCNLALSCSSCIDHFVVSSNLQNQVQLVRTLDCGSNLSDHLPIYTDVSLSVGPVASGKGSYSSDSLKTHPMRLRWDKADLQLYYNLTYEGLLPLLNTHCLDSCSEHCNCGQLWIIDAYYQSIVNILRHADVMAVPRKKANFYKFWWDIEASELKHKSIAAHKIWVSAGRPRTGDVFVQMHAAKSQYKKCLKKLREAESLKFTNELNDCLLEKNMEAFWKSWKSKFVSPKASVHAVNGLTDCSSVAEAFADYFSNVCVPNSVSENDRLLNSFYARFVTYEGSKWDTSVDCNTIANLIHKQHRGKAPGLDGIMSEHLLYCHPIISLLLSKLFKAILSHSYVPQAFSVGVVIPLLKNTNLDKTNLESYRAITLSPTISKLFESYMLGVLQDQLYTSDLQFGFKLGSGCRDAISVLCSTIEHYVAHGSTVNIACLDMSKAFDKVNLYGLAIKLMDRSMPRTFVSVILDWYMKSTVCVKWNECLSSPRRLGAGVRQGGVLSPVLFSVYVNDILVHLEKSEHGCWVAGRYVGALMYADDLVLISITLLDLRRMLHIVCLELSWLDMVLNRSKSHMMRIGPRYNAHISPVIVSGTPLPMENDMSYLGMEICAGRKLKLSVYGRRMKFFRAFNALYAKLGSSASETVILHMAQSFCLPILLYSLESVSISKTVLSSLEHCWTQVLYRIFKISTSDNVNYVSYYTGVLPLRYQIDLRKMRFYHNVYHRQYGSANSSTIVYDVLCKCNVNNLLFKHNVTIIDFIGAYTRAAWHNFASELFGT